MKYKWEIIDFVTISLLILIGTSYMIVPSLLMLVYCTFRIITSPNDSYYLNLIFCANTNVFFLYGAPVCNLIIIISLIVIVYFNSKTKIPYAAVFFVLYEVLHIILYDTFNTFQSFVWCLCVLYPVVFFYNSKCFDLNKAIRYFSIGVSLSIIAGVIYRFKINLGFSANDFNVANNQRFGGGLHDANYFAMMCLILFLLQIVLIVDSKQLTVKEIIARSLISIFVLLFAFLSLSRMFIIVFLIITLFLFLYFGKALLYKMKKNRIIVFVLPFIIVYIIVSLFNNNFFSIIIDKILFRFSSYNKDEVDISGGRIELAKQAIGFLFSNPFAFIFGVGAQSYYERSNIHGYVHNTLIEVLLSFGFLGSIVFIGYFRNIIIFVKNNFALEKHSKLAILPLFCMLICMFFLNSIEVESFYMLYSFLIVLLCSSSKKYFGAM